MLLGLLKNTNNIKHIKEFENFTKGEVNEAVDTQYSFSDEGLKFMGVLRSIDKDPDWSDDMTFTPEYFTEMNRTLGANQAESLIKALMKAGFVIKSKAENK